MFCRNCAEVLIDTDITCPKCGFAAGTGMKYCAQCSDPVPVGAAVCETCGFEIIPKNAGAAVGVQSMAAPDPQSFEMPDVTAMQAQKPVYTQQPTYPQQPIYPQQPQLPPQYVAPGNQSPYYQNNGMQQNMMYSGVEQKSKLTAGILGIFLGSVGIHNFYLGYVAKGVIQLLLTVCSCGMLSFVSGIWGLVEGIMLLTGGISTDGKGIPLKD